MIKHTCLRHLKLGDKFLFTHLTEEEFDRCFKNLGRTLATLAHIEKRVSGQTIYHYRPANMVGIFTVTNLAVTIRVDP